MAQVKVHGLERLEKEFLKLNWRGSKVKTAFRQHMRRGGKPVVAQTRRIVKSAQGVKPDALRRASKTWGWVNINRTYNIFGIKFTPRKNTGKHFTIGDYTNSNQKTPAKQDLAFIVNFWGPKIRLSEKINMKQAADDMQKNQIAFIQEKWRKAGTKRISV